MFRDLQDDITLHWNETTISEAIEPYVLENNITVVCIPLIGVSVHYFHLYYVYKDPNLRLTRHIESPKPQIPTTRCPPLPFHIQGKAHHTTSTSIHTHIPSAGRQIRRDSGTPSRQTRHPVRRPSPTVQPGSRTELRATCVCVGYSRVCRCVTCDDAAQEPVGLVPMVIRVVFKVYVGE